jgi:thiol-disulfide isomerase/thioredoxin
MPGRLKRVCSIAGTRLLMISLLFMPIGCGKAPESMDAGKKADATGKATDSEFTVPDGKPAKILKFIKNLRENRPKFKSQEEAFAYTQNVQNAMIEAGDKILSQKADDEALREATTLKMIGTISQAAILDRSSDQFQKLASDALRIVDALRNDKRPIVAEVANQFWVAARAINFNALTTTERTKLANDAVQNVVKLKLSHEAAGEAAYIADQFVVAGENHVAAAVLEKLAETLNSSDDKKTKSLAANFLSKGRRLRLLGVPLELEGKLLSGTTLDWESYRGKVVLIDFWATWCGPCVADLPNVKALYEKYHSQGFEVIGVSLDGKRKDLESFVKSNSLPWPQVFDTEIQDTNKRPSPMATKFNVYSIPTAFLVDRDGKVLSIEARARELDPILKRMLESVADDAKSTADDVSAAPR